MVLSFHRAKKRQKLSFLKPDMLVNSSSLNPGITYLKTALILPLNAPPEKAQMDAVTSKYIKDFSMSVEECYRAFFQDRIKRFVDETDPAGYK